MNRILVHVKIRKPVIIICLLLSWQASFVFAAEDITGQWEIKIDYHGLERLAKLSFSRNADGSLVGKWGSNDLADVRFENGELSFTHVIPTRARDFKERYTGTLKRGEFTGTMSGDLGNFSVKVTRKKPKSPVLGQWDMKYRFGEREIKGRLTISEKPDGMLVGKWEAESGEHMVSNVKFQDGKLTYTRKSKFGEHELESTFEGTVEGHKLAGTFKSQRGGLPATGERVGAPLVGKWKLTEKQHEAYKKTTTSILRIAGDLTGRYESGGEELIIRNLKLEGDQVSFFLEFRMMDATLRVDFKGKLFGKTFLRGQFKTKTTQGKIPLGPSTTEVTGKKIN